MHCINVYRTQLSSLVHGTLHEQKIKLFTNTFYIQVSV